jgi:hypothetical protein
VNSLIPHPLTSLTVSADPLSGPTVDILANAGVLVPTLERKAALVISVTSCVHSKQPKGGCRLGDSNPGDFRSSYSVVLNSILSTVLNNQLRSKMVQHVGYWVLSAFNLILYSITENLCRSCRDVCKKGVIR